MFVYEVSKISSPISLHVLKQPHNILASYYCLCCVIKRFTVSLDYAKLDLPIVAFVFVSYEPSSKMNQHETARSIGALPGVYGVHIISGEWDLLLKIRGRTIEDVGRLIVDKVRQVPGVHKTLTTTCFETVKEE